MRQNKNPKKSVPVTEEPIQKFETGAIRGATVAGEGKNKFPPRYDLLNPIMLRRLAETFGEGAGKYGDANWLKGMDEKTLLNHCLAHIVMWMQGDRSEDHLAHAMWNLGAIMHFEETRPELLNLQTAVQEGGFYLTPEQRAVKK
jgi:hypothetical protein